MVKVSSMDIISVLRRFEIASEDNVPRNVEQVKITNTTPLSTLVTFRFLRKIFYILFDDDGLDDPEYVLKQIQLIDENVEGEVLHNPQDHRTEYALPFKGKDVYVFVAKSAKRRLDSELADRHTGTSRSTWQKHIKAGHVSVNGEVQLSPKANITDSDSIAIDMPDALDSTWMIMLLSSTNQLVF
jgi:23S rRNA pseudouridine1911/1915/1917 synthase